MTPEVEEEPAMGKKKQCFGSDEHVCMVKDCPYMSECIRVVWEKKMEIVLERARSRRGARESHGRARSVES
jgi:hypothetical protein